MNMSFKNMTQEKIPSWVDHIYMSKNLWVAKGCPEKLFDKPIILNYALKGNTWAFGQNNNPHIPFSMITQTQVIKERRKLYEQWLEEMKRKLAEEDVITTEEDHTP